MAREARKISKSGCYYIVLKGAELYRTNEDKTMFREILEKNFATGIVHGCEITKEEIHLVVKEGVRGISMTMKPVTTSYARYFNRTHNREGKLFAGRFKSEPLETEEEIEERLKDIKKSDAKKSRQTANMVKRKETPKKTKAPEKKEQVKTNTLPSWLL